MTELEEIQNTVTTLSSNPKLREEFNAREKALKDKNSALETAKAEGVAIGKAEGVAIGKAEGEYEGKIKIAQNLLDVFDHETVAKKTELPIEDVRKLREML